MEDILLVQLLKKKGLISERDIHELHELASVNMETEPTYSAKTQQPMSIKDSTHISEEEARQIVAAMYHIDNGRKYVGEKFDMYKAKEVCERYRGIIPSHITYCDVYIAINSQYHDYCSLFKSWFNDEIDHKIIESAITYWFDDDDCKADNKVLKYLKKH